MGKKIQEHWLYTWGYGGFIDWLAKDMSELSSPVFGPNPMCDHLGPTTGHDKALSVRPYRGKLPFPHRICCIASTLQSLRGVTVKDSSSSGSLAFTYLNS